MSKRIHHMGMTLAQKEHERWHKEGKALTPKQHDALMKRMGITREQDEEWHRTHQTVDEQRIKGMKKINPFAVGGGFLRWCIGQDWLIQRGKEYYVTKDGERQLRERFGIEP